MNDFLDDIDLFSIDMETDKTPEVSLGDIRDVMDEPNVQFLTQQIMLPLGVSRVLAAGGTNDVTTKSVCLSVDSGYLKIRSTDFTHYFTYRIPLKNQENLITETLVVPIKTMIDLMKNSSRITTIYKTDDGSYRMKFSGGSLPLEVYSIADKYSCEGDFEEVSTMSSSALQNVLMSINQIVSKGNTPVERYAYLSDDSIFITYLWGMLYIKGAFAPFTMQAKDCSLLSHLLKSYDGDLEIHHTDLFTKIIAGNKWEYVFPTFDVDYPVDSIDLVSNADKSNLMIFSMDDFRRVVSVGATLSTSNGKIEFNFGNRQLDCTLKFKGSDSLIPILATEIVGNPTPLENSITISAKLLDLFFRANKTITTISVALSPDYILLFNENIHLLIKAEA